jgi:prefoldin subunit 5
MTAESVTEILRREVEVTQALQKTVADALARLHNTITTLQNAQRKDKP